MMKRVTNYRLTRVVTQKGEEMWAVEYEKVVTRLEHVVIPLPDIDLDDVEAAKEEAVQILACNPEEVEVEL